MGIVSFSEVEETLATPESFRFSGGSIVTLQELPSTGGWPADLNSRRLIQTDQPVNIGFQWSVAGDLVPLLSGQIKWEVKVEFEQIGVHEFDLGAAGLRFVNYVPVSGHQYHVVINLQPGTVPEGIYEIVVRLRLRDANHRPLPAGGFGNLGKFEFYNA